jgi:hypothetical protein
MTRNTLATLSYGISTPEELFEKLKADGVRLTAQPHPHDVFNFVITSAVLNEWIRKVYRNKGVVREFAEALDKADWNLLPQSTTDWLIDRPHILQAGPDIRYHVLNILRLTWHTANASKHFHWTSSSGVTDIQPEPIVGDYFQYFFTSPDPDLYVEYDGHAYGLSEIRSVLEQFFEGLLRHIGVSGVSAQT